MPQRKPRGINGVAKLTGGVSEPEFVPTELPATKSEIERVIATAAFRSMVEHGWKAWPEGIAPRQLGENDFDFAFDSLQRPEYLDLAEIAPLSGSRRGFEDAPATFSVGKRVDAILRVVTDKATHYGRERRSGVHLLLYITDHRFHVSDGIVALLKSSLRREHYRFLSISYFAQIDQETGVLEVLYPSPDGVPFISVDDERRMRAGTVTNYDPRAWKLDSERGGFFSGLGPTSPDPTV